MSPAPSIRRIGAELTRTHIVAVARELFAAQGPAFTSLQDVADAAGLSRPGLLRHFSSKADVMRAVADDFDEETMRVADGAESLRAAAEKWASGVPQYRQLCAVLLHEALTSLADDRGAFVQHHERLLSQWSIAPDRSGLTAHVAAPYQASVLTAVWEGLQVMRAYLPDIDPHMLWSPRRPSVGDGPAPTAGALKALQLESIVSTGPGYASGRRRRESIVTDAAALFSVQGFHATTMREIAARVNVAPSALLYHFADKAQLLAEVLRRRDIQMVQRRGGEMLDPVAELRDVGAEARRDELAEEGLVALYTVLSTEAAVSTHPAHKYFRDRFERSVSYFENVFARAAIALGMPLDARREATLLVALWDGMQYQHLLAGPHDNTDIAAVLDHYIAGVIHPARARS